MPRRNKHRVQKRTIIGDQEILAGLRTLPDYEPRNKNHSVESIAGLEQRRSSIHAAKLAARQQVAALNQEEIDVEWELHRAVQGAKHEVLTQYGPDAQEIRLLGLKRRSDYRLPAKRAGAEE